MLGLTDRYTMDISRIFFVFILNYIIVYFDDFSLSKIHNKKIHLLQPPTTTPQPPTTQKNHSTTTTPPQPPSPQKNHFLQPPSTNPPSPPSSPSQKKSQNIQI